MTKTTRQPRPENYAMTRVRLALLNAAYDDTNARRNYRRDLDAELVEFSVNEGELPTDFSFDGCVVTGSRASVYWDEDWIPPFKEWLAAAIDEGLPFFGVCYGHQILADVLGGQVEDMGRYEVGYRTVTHFENDPIFANLDRKFTVFTTHSDRVRVLPEGAKPLAATEYGNHGFRLDNVVGVQFHPEYDLQTARELVEEKDISEERRARLRADLTEAVYAEAQPAKGVFDNFIAEVTSKTQQPVAAD